MRYFLLVLLFLVCWFMPGQVNAGQNFNITYVNNTPQPLSLQWGVISCWYRVNQPRVFSLDPGSSTTFLNELKQEVFTHCSSSGNVWQYGLQITGNGGGQNAYYVFNGEIGVPVPNPSLSILKALGDDSFAVNVNNVGMDSNGNWNATVTISLGNSTRILKGLEVVATNLTGLDTVPGQNTVYKFYVESARFGLFGGQGQGQGSFYNGYMNPYLVKGSCDQETWAEIGQLIPPVGTFSINDSIGITPSTFYLSPSPDQDFLYIMIIQCALALPATGGGQEVCDTVIIDLSTLSPPPSVPNFSGYSLTCTPQKNSQGTLSVIANKLSQLQMAMVIDSVSGNPIGANTDWIYDYVYFVNEATNALITNLFDSAGYMYISDVAGPYTTLYNSPTPEARSGQFSWIKQFFQWLQSLFSKLIKKEPGSDKPGESQFYYFTTSNLGESTFIPNIRLNGVDIGSSVSGQDLTISGLTPPPLEPSAITSTQITFNNNLIPASNTANPIWISNFGGQYYLGLSNSATPYLIFYFVESLDDDYDDDDDQNMGQFQASVDNENPTVLNFQNSISTGHDSTYIVGTVVDVYGNPYFINDTLK